MRRGRSVWAASLLLSGLALSACSKAADPADTSAPVPSRVVFESNSAALQAAKASYLDYLEVADEVANAGGEGVDALEAYVTAAAMQDERASASTLRKRDLRVEGETRLVEFKMQKVDLTSGSVAAYACIDLSSARVRDARGFDVTPATRVDRQTSRVEFAWDGERLRLDENVPWSGQSIC